MIYVLFLAIMGSGTLTYEFKTQLACETTLHNFKKQTSAGFTSNAIGFCQAVQK